MAQDTDVTRQDFEQAALDCAEAARALRRDGKRFSDLSDSDGLQYIDLVMEGGGTLGIALLGYIHVLEQAGLRFIGIGGTSAGAISAIALAAAGRPPEQRGARLMDVLANIPMASFVDGKSDDDSDARDAIDAWIEGRSLFAKAWTAAQVVDNLREIQGLNRGVRFLEWMQRTLGELSGGKSMTVASLRERMTDAPELWVHEAALPEDFAHLPVKPFETLPDGRRCYRVNPQRNALCVVAADIATESRIELPRMARLFWPEPDEVDVALFARASMSIPFFFAPLRVPSLPVDAARPLWQDEMDDWSEHCFEGDFLPKEHCFVDGGVLSNFPIRAFHAVNRVPLRPTFGVKLQWDEHCHKVRDVVDIGRYTFNSARHGLDDDFVRTNPDYCRLVQYIDTGTIGWLDFAMPKATKLKLFRLGAQAAVAFLRGFDWEAYKQVRRHLIAAASQPA
jgi:NTE family protein